MTAGTRTTFQRAIDKATELGTVRTVRQAGPGRYLVPGSRGVVYTVLGSVPQNHAGVASGTNNAISRVAGLLAIATVGAIVSAQFGSALDRELAGRSLTPAARAAVREVKDRPLTGGVPAHPELDSPVEAASVHAYRVGLGVGGGLVILGGVISLIGIVNPARGRSPQRPEAHGASTLVYPCPERQREADAALAG